MVICPECGKEVKKAKFCSNCGSLLPEEVEIPVEENFEEPIDEVNDEPIETNIVKSTKFCSNCGTELDVSVVVCPECGFRLIPDESDSQTKYCQTCGEKIHINAEICPHCGVRVGGVARSEEKSVVLAALLSFIFPGLGQLYNGQSHKAVTFIIAYIVSAVLIFILIGFILVVLVWVWSLIDVIKSTEAINRGEYVEDKLF